MLGERMKALIIFSRPGVIIAFLMEKNWKNFLFHVHNRIDITPELAQKSMVCVCVLNLQKKIQGS